MTARAPITSLSNPAVKAAVRLRLRREREATGLTLVDGARELRRAVEAGVEVDTVFMSTGRVLGDDARWIVDRIANRPGITVPVSDPVLARLAYGDRNDGVVGLVRSPGTALASIALPSDPLVLIADGIEKPGNIGAIVRSADAAGADAVVFTDPTTDPFNPNAIRASIGTIFGIALGVADRAEVGDWLRAAAVRQVTARVDADRLYSETDLTGPLAIVVGSEATGLADAWSDPEIVPVRLPMLGRADSLNVSVAAAVLLYEARRQRDASSARREGRNADADHPH